MIGERYIDPFTDFGFKKIFGSEPNKDLLIDFINVLMDGKIVDLAYTKKMITWVDRLNLEKRYLIYIVKQQMEKRLLLNYRK